MSDLHKPLKKLESINKTIFKNPDEFNDKWKKKGEDFTKKSAETGWIWPIKSPATDYIKFTSMEEADLDSRFTKLFESFDDNLKQPLNKYKVHLKHPVQKLLDEAVICYEHKFFQASSVAAFAVLEGALSVLLDSGSSTRYIDPIRNKTLSFEEKLNIFHINSSIIGFCEKIFKKVEFCNSNLIDINRHSLMHGRANHEYEYIDTLKILNAISAVLWMFNELESQNNFYET